MRNLLALAALLAFLPVAKAADSKGEFTANAEYRLRYQNDMAMTGTKDDTTGFENANFTSWKQRGKLDFGFRSGEKFSLHSTMIHNALWGNTVFAGNSNSSTPDGVGDTTGTTGADATNMVLVNQFYATWMINDTWSLKAGRGGFTLADGSVISQNDWEATPNAFEGVLVNWEHEMLRLSLFTVKAVDSDANKAAMFTGGSVTGDETKDPETGFYGFAADLKNLPEFLKMANIHVFRVEGKEMTAPTAIAKQNITRYGVAVGGDTMGIDYKADIAGVSGSTTTFPDKSSVSSRMWQAEVGYSLPEMMKSRFHFAYHSDTGNKEATAAGSKVEAYDPFFYEKHGAAGLMDVLAWGNLTFMKIGASFSPMDQLDVGLSWWKFQATTVDDGDNVNPSYGNNGFGYDEAWTGAGAASTSKNLGQEIDLAVTKKYDGGLSIGAHYGRFTPGSYFKDADLTQTYSQFFLEGKMTF